MKRPALPQLSKPEWLMAAVSGLLLLLIAAQLLAPGTPAGQEEGGEQVPPIELDTSPLPRPSFASLQSLAELRERPLFEEERRPPAPPVQQTRDLAREFQERWKLTGVIVAGQARFAMLEDLKARGSSVQLRQGEQLGGWTLDALEAGGAQFSREDQQLRLELAK